MLRRRPAYNTHAQMVEAAREQTVMNYDAPEPEPVAAVADQAAEAKPAYTIKTGWVDTADRTRTWKLLGPNGAHMAEISAKRDAQGMADFLNFVDGDGHLRTQFLSRAERKSTGRGR